ncbi:MAG: hypothetical protein ACRCU2_03570 [Planktothrix sp.]
MSSLRLWRRMRSPPSTPTQPGPTRPHRLPGVPVFQTVSTDSLGNGYRTGMRSPTISEESPLKLLPPDSLRTDGGAAGDELKCRKRQFRG